jgi:outer membrane protein OmpA-like peptidoglycan-associated protein
LDDAWSDPEPFPFNSNEYSVGHPALTPDGRTLFFASDMPGGFGGVDIYVSEWQSGKWTDPFNLGPVINTEGDEMFPFIHPEGWLFYSSDGLPGLGSMDIFYSNVFDYKKPSTPINLGVPVNSNADDFAFIIDKDFKRGYFSSNREKGWGNDDMYAFDMHFALRKIIRGTIRDTKQNILADVKVELVNEKDSIVLTTFSSGDGIFEFFADKNQKYSIRGSLNEHASGYLVVDDNPGETETIANLVLERLPEFMLYGIINDASTNEPLENVRIKMLNNSTGEAQQFITSRNGDFTRKLAGFSLEDDISLKFELVKHGYAPRTITYERKLDREGQFDIHGEVDMAMDKLEPGVDLGKLLGLNRIVYDKDKADLRPDATKELDKIAEFMNLYPEMEVELGAHTDCRGFAAHNLRLSINRAETATWYIQGRISNPTRLYHRGYGEIRPVNKCVCEGTRSVPCSEEEHQQNNRVEFMILRVE